MADKDPTARERIVSATVDLLDEEPDIDRITVRRIAGRAGVGIGAINYHFQSKENLLNLAVQTSIGDLSDAWMQVADEDADPVTRLKTLLRANADVAAGNPKLARITVSHILLRGEIDVPYVILPALRDIYGGTKSESELKLIGMMLVVTLQVAFLRADAFRKYAGIDVFDDDQRNATIDALVESVLPERK